MIQCIVGHRLLRLLSCMALLMAGCAMPKFQKAPQQIDPAEKRAAHRDEMLRHFEERRDSAQFLAAMDRWREGDPFTCEAQLRSLITRSPNHLEGRRALADLALERGDVAHAEAELRSLLGIAPEDAHTLHSLGLLLDMTGRREEARAHLSRAAELSPENTFFQLCAEEGRPLPNATLVASPNGTLPSAPAIR
jgi:Flp pilus assembly protein TadD